jgi:light-regulated signal transduction histidine kinase (bacteriophytochrome)
MGSLVDDLLAFSRIGHAETQKTTVHLEQLVKGVVGEIAPDTRGRNIAWRIGTLPVCYGDLNAVKFTRTCPRAEIEIGSINPQTE